MAQSRRAELRKRSRCSPRHVRSSSGWGRTPWLERVGGYQCSHGRPRRRCKRSRRYGGYVSGLARPVLLYDADCRLCRFAARVVARSTAEEPRLLGLEDPPADPAARARLRGRAWLIAAASASERPHALGRRGHAGRARTAAGNAAARTVVGTAPCAAGGRGPLCLGRSQQGPALAVSCPTAPRRGVTPSRRSTPTRC